MSDFTTIQVTKTVRDQVKRAAEARAGKLGISYLSMVDYLSLVTADELSTSTIQ